MTEFMDVVIKSLGMILLAFTTYVLIPTIRDWREKNLSEKEREELTFWIETGVLWAKQWLQTSTGAEKKEAVFTFVKQKVSDLNLPYNDEEIDKAIEAFYSTVKDVVDVTTGKDTTRMGGAVTHVSD